VVLAVLAAPVHRDGQSQKTQYAGDDRQDIR
jgi:hypothetical protein